MVAHKHAELMLQYAQDAMETDKPWERWEVKINNHLNWKPMTTGTHPSWALHYDYRRKPRTICIGEYDVPEPLRVAPETGTEYWVACPDVESFAACFPWMNAPKDPFWLKRGLIHLTPEAAELHGRALVSLTEVKP